MCHTFFAGLESGASSFDFLQDQILPAITLTSPRHSTLAPHNHSVARKMSAKAIREFHGKRLVSKWISEYGDYDVENRSVQVKILLCSNPMFETTRNLFLGSSQDGTYKSMALHDCPIAKDVRL